MECPSCQAQVSLAQVSDQELFAEAGRRMVGRRKGARGAKGAKVWKRHNPGAGKCYCGGCVMIRLKKVEDQLAKRVKEQIELTGLPPVWAEEDRKRLEGLRKAVEEKISPGAEPH